MNHLRVQLTREHLLEYLEAPDRQAYLRRLYKLPENRRYSVTVWPPARAGSVHLDDWKLTRP